MQSECRSCAEILVPQDGVTYIISIEPTDIYYNSQTVKKSWYYTPDGVNLDLHTALYHHAKATSHTSKMSGTDVTTDGDHYNKNVWHHIFRQTVASLEKGDRLKIESYCDDFGDDYSYLYYKAREAQIIIVRL